MQETERGTTHTYTQIEKSYRKLQSGPRQRPPDSRQGKRGEGIAEQPAAWPKYDTLTHTHTRGGSGTEDYPRSSHSTLSTNRTYSHNMQQERTGKEEGRESAGSKLSEIYHNNNNNDNMVFIAQLTGGL